MVNGQTLFVYFSIWQEEVDHLMITKSEVWTQYRSKILLWLSIPYMA